MSIKGYLKIGEQGSKASVLPDYSRSVFYLPIKAFTEFGGFG